MTYMARVKVMAAAAWSSHLQVWEKVLLIGNLGQGPTVQGQLLRLGLGWRLVYG